MLATKQKPQDTALEISPVFDHCNMLLKVLNDRQRYWTTVRIAGLVGILQGEPVVDYLRQFGQLKEYKVKEGIVYASYFTHRDAALLICETVFNHGDVCGCGWAPFNNITEGEIQKSKAKLNKLNRRQKKEWKRKNTCFVTPPDDLWPSFDELEDLAADPESCQESWWVEFQDRETHENPDRKAFELFWK